VKKSDFRKKIRILLSGLGDEEKRRLSAEIRTHISRSALWRSASEVMLFSPLPDEPDISRLIETALEEGKTTSLPRIEGTAINFYKISGMQALEKNKYGILEPPPRERWQPSAAPAEHSCICLVPGRAFTLRGLRLGRGGGYYDRFLSEYDSFLTSVGLCFAVQIFPEVPSGVHDKALDYICSEAGLRHSGNIAPFFYL
jgi:5-formyltetrahydrofolate cyclo-ligase